MPTIMSERPAPLEPLHSSIRRRQPRYVPKDMSTTKITDEARVTLTQVALRIFTDCVNRGVSFQDALLAVYLSGLDHGSEAQKELVAERTTVSQEE